MGQRTDWNRRSTLVAEAEMSIDETSPELARKVHDKCRAMGCQTILHIRDVLVSNYSLQVDSCVNGDEKSQRASQLPAPSSGAVPHPAPSDSPP